MVEIVEDAALRVANADDIVFVVRHYRIVDGFTLDECRDAIDHRHIGRAWGS